MPASLPELRTLAAGGLIFIAGLSTSCTSGDSHSRVIDFETSEGTKLAFDVSPDGSTIVLDLLGQLWTMPAEGGQATPLTDAVREGSDDLRPTFSPDGETVAFSADRPGGAGLFRVSLGDRSVERLTTGPHRSTAWSPDGERIAFIQGQSIHLLDPDGGDPSEVPIDSLPQRGTSDPSWSPRDGRLVFVNAPPGSRYGGPIWAVSPDGGVPQPLSNGDLRARAPIFSPDGTRIAFFSPDSASQFQVWVMEPNGEPIRLTSQEDVTPVRVRWVADGSRLLYHAEGCLWTVSETGGIPSEVPFSARVRFVREEPDLRPVQFMPPETEREARGHMGLALAPGGSRVAMIALGQLWVIEVGGEPTAVSPVPPTAAGPSWSPDEEAIVWSAGPGGAEDLFVTDLSTGETRQATSLPGAETAPSWSPDGETLAFIHFEKPALDTPAWDWSDAEPRLRAIPANGPRVGSTDETTDLGAGYTTWGFFGPSQEAPQWSPDSEPQLLFLQGSSVVLASLTGERRQIQLSDPPSPTYLTWSADQTLVYVEDGLLWRASFDGTSEALGEPERISDDAALYASTSRDGSVLYLSPDGLRIQRPTGQVEELGWPLDYRAPGPEPLLVRNVRILSGSSPSPGAPSDVLIENGRIERIGAAGVLDAVEGIRTVDAEGRIAIPGLIDLHTHLWDDATLPAALYYGVTTIRDMGSTSVARLAAHREAIEAGVWAGPRIILGGVQFWGVGTTTGGGGYMVSDDSARARATDLLGAFRADFLKMRVFSDWAETAKLIAAAHDEGWPTSGHIAAPLPLMAAGVDGMEHLGPSGFRTDEIVYDDMIQLFRHGGVWIVPTAVAYSSVGLVLDDEALFDEPETAAFTTPFLKWWAFRQPPTVRPGYDRFTRFTHLSARKLFDGGVTISAGTDAPVLPWALHRELEELVSAGIPPAAVLTAATKTAAEILGASEEIGTIEEGKWADMVLLNSDPTEEIRNTRDIWMVVKGGVEMDREGLRSWVARSAVPVER